MSNILALSINLILRENQEESEIDKECSNLIYYHIVNSDITQQSLSELCNKSFKISRAGLESL